MELNKIQRLSDNLKKSFNDPLRKKTWQSGMGLVVFAVFLISSIVVGNRSVYALNQAIGYYGYYSSTYGYNASTTSSDAPPAAPTTLSCSTGSNSATCTWTAPTMTTASPATAIATGSGSISSYTIAYHTSSITSCTDSSATATSSTTASVTIGSLTSGTTYYIALCAVDNNVNRSVALTGSFTVGTAGGTGGGGGGGTTGGTATGAIVAQAPAVSAAPAAGAGAVAAAPAPAAVTTQVQQSATEFGVTLSTSEVATTASFVASGTSAATVKLGSGERLALVRDQLETLGRVNVAALEQLAAGQKPTVRNLAKEQSQLPRVLQAFERVFGRRPNFRTADDLRWNTMMYRVRFPRDLAKERVGIARFRTVFKRLPSSPLDWAVVRASGYVR